MTSRPFGFSLDEDDPRAEPRRRPLTVQVLLTVVAVYAISAVGAAALGFVVGPRMLRERIEQSPGIPASARDEVARIYATTTLVQTFVSILAGLAVWSIFAVLTARSLARSVATMQRAAELVGSGRYDFAVQATQLGPEAEGFARTFNEMAARLHDVETTRRRMLSDLAHELRTPIATLDGYLEAFEDGLATPDPATVRMLRSQTRRLARLVQDVSAVSRVEEQIDRLVLVPTAPEDLVAPAVAGIGPAAAARGLAVDTRITPHLPRVAVDPERMAQVLGNLLENAVRHARTRITVTAERAATDGLRLVVHDDGDGIPPESLPHVFERFYRLDAARDRNSGGSGIGLAIVKALVGAHGGQVTAQSAGLGQGATFTVVLPAARATP